MSAAAKRVAEKVRARMIWVAKRLPFEELVLVSGNCDVFLGMIRSRSASCDS